jgi:hypothetical protein
LFLDRASLQFWIFLVVERRVRLQMKKSHLKCEKTHVAAQIKLNEHMTHPKLFVVFVSRAVAFAFAFFAFFTRLSLHFCLLLL